MDGPANRVEGERDFIAMACTILAGAVLVLMLDLSGWWLALPFGFAALVLIPRLTR